MQIDTEEYFEAALAEVHLYFSPSISPSIADEFLPEATSQKHDLEVVGGIEGCDVGCSETDGEDEGISFGGSLGSDADGGSDNEESAPVDGGNVEVPLEVRGGGWTLLPLFKPTFVEGILIAGLWV